MKARLTALREAVRTGFWAIPSVCVVLAVALALILVEVDRREPEFAFTFDAGPDGAREVLGAITSAMITFTGLVFSITIVVLQLTSSQFSPRVLRTFLRDRQTQMSMGVFVATFVYSVIVLRTVYSGDDEVFVPALSTTVGVGLLLCSVGMFVAYIHHVAVAIQVSSIIAAIGNETRSTIDSRFPTGADSRADSDAPAPTRGKVTLVIPAPRSGVIVSRDEARLVTLAKEAGVMLRTQVRIGEFVPEGAPLMEVVGEVGELDVEKVVSCVALGRNRTMQCDVGFGIRQLVDIAEKALSPGINDPTTAVESLDQLHDLLRRLATRHLRSGVHVDDIGAVRLVQPPEDLVGFVALALDEIEQYGKDARQVIARIDTLLADVTAAALPEHRPVLEQRLKGRGGRTASGPAKTSTRSKPRPAKAG